MSDNPYAFSEPVGHTPRPKRRFVFTLFRVFLYGAIALVVLALLLPATRRARPAARRTQCKNNLKQIGLALRNYHEAYDAFPPAYTVDANGKPLHSWRTLLLPFLEQQSLYKTIDLSKPWDHPSNAEAFKTQVFVYLCPGGDQSRVNSAIPPNHTTYFAIVTPHSCMRPAEPRRLSDIHDGTGNTLMVIEAPPDRAVHWMSPTDANEDFLLNFGTKSNFAHTGGMHVLFADGAVRYLSEKIPVESRLALISINGNEKLPDF